jgi:hypothetical protein
MRLVLSGCTQTKAAKTAIIHSATVREYARRNLGDVIARVTGTACRTCLVGESMTAVCMYVCVCVCVRAVRGSLSMRGLQHGQGGARGGDGEVCTYVTYPCSVL